MTPSSLTDAAPGFLREVGTGLAKYYSFVPAPLPPKLEWNEDLILLLADAQQVMGHLAGVSHTIENPHLLIRPFLDREAVLSSQIEGTQTTYKQLALFKAADESKTSDAHEVMNYVVALEHGLERLDQLPVSLRLIKELHAILLKGVRGQERTPGEVRRSQNWIGKPGSSLQEAAFVPPAPEFLADALSDLERHIHEPSKIPPLVRLALVHYQFETIHAFLDGNGRLGRLLIILLICEWKLLPAPLLYLSAFFHRYRQDYYDGLQQVRTHGRWADWIAFFLRGVRSQAQDAIDRATRLVEARREFGARVRDFRSSGALYELIDALVAQPFITIPKAQKILGVTHRAASQNVDKLVDRGILREIPNEFPRLFLCDQVMRIVSPESDPST